MMECGRDQTRCLQGWGPEDAGDLAVAAVVETAREQKKTRAAAPPI
jgi:hypothetical protein